MRTMLPPAALLAILVLIGASSSRAQFVMPTGYSYGSTSPDSGYPDSGGELTDGTTSLSFMNSLSGPQIAAWTGWQFTAPTIVFQFASAQTFSRIEVGTNRWDAAGIGVLTGVTIAGSPFTTGIGLGDGVRDWLVFDGTFSTTIGDTLTISLTAGSQWIMLDEVRFTAIPEPAETGALVSLLAVGAVVLAQRRKSLSASAA